MLPHKKRPALKRNICNTWWSQPQNNIIPCLLFHQSQLKLSRILFNSGVEFKVFWRSLRYWISIPQLDVMQWAFRYFFSLKKKLSHPSNSSYDEDTGFRSCRTHQRGNRVFLFFLSTRYFSFSENKISRSNTPLIMLSVRVTFQKDGFLFPLPATRTEFSLLILWILYLTLHCWVIC